MSVPAIVAVGVGSDGSVDQFDGCRAPRGIMLRWFLSDLDLPQLGFDVHRATIPDIPPLPFDDINVAALSGKPSWDYAGIAPNAPVRVRFSGTAWRIIQVRAETVGAGIEVVAFVDGAETLRETLATPNTTTALANAQCRRDHAERRRNDQLHRFSPDRGHPLLDPHRASLPAGVRCVVPVRAARRHHRGRRSRDAAAGCSGCGLEWAFRRPIQSDAAGPAHCG
jgi:hypothetical protein